MGSGQHDGVSLSVGIPNFGAWTAGEWRALLDVARAAEAAGVDRIIVNDHVVMGPNTEAYTWGRFPTKPDGPWLEPLTVLGAIAAVTSRIRLATGILIAGLRPAAILAKSVATLDVMSAGRLDLGVGVGWQRAEYDAEGLDFAGRGQLLEDTIGACRALWSDLPASFSSASISFADVFCSPRPVQPRLPVWFSGTLNERNLRRIDDLGDGWIPIMGSTVDDVRVGAQRLRERCGRPIAVQASVPTRAGSTGERDPAATIAGVPAWIEAGATDIYVNVAAFAAGPADAPRVFGELVTAFEAAT